MGIFSRKKKGRVVGQSASSLATVPNSIPNSGFGFIDNSQGAAQAIQELSKVLDEISMEPEFQGISNEQLQKYQNLLNEGAGNYANSSVDCCSSKQLWRCDGANSELLLIAWKCAAGSYDSSYNMQLENYSFHQYKAIKPSLDGTTKATVMTIVKSNKSLNDSAIKVPIFVVAVRGTKSTVDKMVNLNIAPKSVDGFIIPGFEAHAGFLTAAKELEREVSKSIDQAFRAGQSKRVLFTGHSAGAAVASLLFMHYRRHGLNGLPIQFSSITFGGPPVLKSTEPELQLTPNPGELWLNIINEYDLIARADRPYILSLVDLLRSVYGRPPLQERNDAIKSSQSGRASNNWDLQFEYRHYGHIIIFQVSEENSNPHGESVPTGDDLSLSAWKVPWDDFSQLLFTRAEVHGRIYYERHICMIAKDFLP